MIIKKDVAIAHTMEGYGAKEILKKINTQVRKLIAQLRTRIIEETVHHMSENGGNSGEQNE